jgi:hypothetical protein
VPSGKEIVPWQNTEEVPGTVDSAREPDSAIVAELMRLCHGRSNDGLKVRADNFLHAVNLRKFCNRLKIGLPLLIPIRSESFDGNVKPDFIPVLETIGNRLFGRIYPDRYTVHRDDLDTGAEGRFGIPEDLKGDIIDSRDLRVTRQRNVNCVRNLSGKTVVSQS